MVKLTCSSCGGKLKITEDIERFACVYCGTESVVNRGDGIVSLKAASESLKRIEKSAEGIEKHTEIIAGEIKLKKIRKIAALEQVKSNIEENPQIHNPEYDKLVHSKRNFKDWGISISIPSFLGVIWWSLFEKSDPITDFPFFLTLATLCGGLILLFKSHGITIPSKLIVDEKQKEINTQELLEINNQLRDLQQKAHKIEENFLK